MTRTRILKPEQNEDSREALLYQQFLALWWMEMKWQSKWSPNQCWAPQYNSKTWYSRDLQQSQTPYEPVLESGKYLSENNKDAESDMLTQDH